MRQRLLLTALLSALLLFSACSPSQPQVTTVFVSTIVKETQIVENTRIVPEIRYVTAEVTRIVRETVVVLPAPTSIPMGAVLAPPTAIPIAQELPLPTAIQRVDITPFPPFTPMVNITAGNSLVLLRAQHTATLLYDGRLLLVGGSSELELEQIARGRNHRPC